ncbi:bifunctional precorrin-2 dehydrogenase/sirohydrochlorin ferrochelatase [uncultured Selenomonas sp.]|uniref:precorrin-2 dehydrogenase/sirohydrochlorin ferrochelatase family protein n=1 Tax=uncultured Selenomonas sp. TaxID=159275 RepID=UPI0028DC94B7|nr:bifunctional precorrin-2 dehydrogenase/sirohydrochlorin ferrochelatase [uncultured Selenomonas sp.]
MYPIQLCLAGRAVLVAGGGAVAHRKVRGLLAARAAVTVVAPELSLPLAQLAAEKSIAWLEQLATEAVFAALPRPLLVFCATDDRTANAAFGKAAREAGALVNDATSPELCDFFLPAALRDGDLLVTVSTGGASPALSRALKRRLAAHLGAGWGDWLERLSRLRREARGRIEGSRGREDFWRMALSEHVLDLVEEGRLDEAEAELNHALDRFGTES